MTSVSAFVEKFKKSSKKEHFGGGWFLGHF
jgi:hypothetical protein